VTAINKNGVVLTAKGKQMAVAVLASQHCRAIVRENGQRSVVMPQPKLLSIPFGRNAKIRITHHSLLCSATQQIICNGIFHPYRKPKGAEKIFVGSIKQRVWSELHIVSLTLVAKSMVVPLEVLYLIFDKKSSTPEKTAKK
jgi:hypothetical protein